MVATVQKCHYEALKTLKMLWFPALFQMNPTRGFTASVRPSCIGNAQGINAIFQNILWFVVFLSR